MRVIISVEYGKAHDKKIREFAFEMEGEREDIVESCARHHLLRKIMNNNNIYELIKKLDLELC